MTLKKACTLLLLGLALSALLVLEPKLPAPPLYRSIPQNVEATIIDDYHESLPGRLAEAVYVATELKRFDSYLQLICPKKQAIGDRPGDHPPPFIGTPCEPWINREVIEVFWHVADRNMIALEWSSGSGSLWTLRRGLTLHTVEHCDAWLDDVRNHVHNQFPQLEDRWFPYHVQTSIGCEQESGDWEAGMRVFADYASYPRKHLSNATPTGFWDVINIDGRFRDGCMVEAINLVKPQYGIVLLDNSERTQYVKAAEIPSHWLVVSFRSKASETSLWMSCPTVMDANCSRARQEIAEMMKNVPPATVGGRYKAHMARARADGVPGA